MSKLTDFHEDYNEKFNDFEDDNFGTNLNDLTLKNNLNFYKEKFNLQTTSAFNFGGKNSANHSYKLSHESKNCNTTIEKNNQGEKSYECNVSWKKINDIEIGSYFYMFCNQSKDLRDFSSKAQLRLHFRDQFLFSFGFEEFDFLKSRLPNVYSAYASYGRILDKEVKDPVRLSLNGYLNYNNLIQQVSGVKFFLLGENSRFNSLFELKFENQVEEATVDTSSNLSGRNTGAPIVTHNALLNIRFNNSAENDVTYGSNFSYNVNDKQANMELMASKKLDKIKLIGKLDTKRSMTLGVSSKLDDIELNFTTKSTLDSKSDKVEDNEFTKHWVNFDFGLSVQIERI